MKLYTRNLSLGCLAAFALFAAPTPAQRLKAPIHPTRVVLGDASTGQTQERTKGDAASPETSGNCTYQFTSGSGMSYLQFCVNENGSVTGFQSPSGVEQLNPQNVGAYEGYGVCDVTNGNTAYYDYAYPYATSGNWNPATTVTSTKTEVKIERTTSDG